MYKGNRIFTIICARGGSKGVPKKNILPLLGKPLIAHTIEHAKTLQFLDRLLVSTEDPEIAAIAKEFGAEVPFMRPKELALDTIPIEPAIIYSLTEAEKLYRETYDIIMLLDPTNPVRSQQDIENALDLLLADPETESVISVVISHKNPYRDLFELSSLGYVTVSKKSPKIFIRRQDTPSVYAANASIYVARKGPFVQHRSFLLRKTRAYVMPEDTTFDIDRPLDFELVAYLLERRRKQRI